MFGLRVGNHTDLESDKTPYLKTGLEQTKGSLVL